MVPETYARWDAVEELSHHLEDAALYLEACIGEDPGDGSLIRAALGDIARVPHQGRESGV
jgi:DNA-binding phage protein